MPSDAIIAAKYLRLFPALSPSAAVQSNLPAFSAVAGPGAGHVTRHPVVGRNFANLPSGARHTLPACDLVNWFELNERFLRRPVLNADLASGTEATREPANPDFEVLGTNATSALTTFADGGGVTITTAGASGDFNVIAPHLDTAQTAWAAAKWNTKDSVLFETVVKTGASVAAVKFWAGLKLTNTSVTATDDNQAYFLFDTGNTNVVSATNIQVCTSRAGTDTFIDSGITVVAATSYHLLITIDVNRVPSFYVNGLLVGVGNGTPSTGVVTAGGAGALTDDVDLIPYVGVHALTAAAKAITVRGIRCGKLYND